VPAGGSGTLGRSWVGIPSGTRHPAPGTAAQAAAADASLNAARTAVKNARQQQIGLYEPGQPLRLLAFELRLLSRQAPPDR
jgi:hypothetical protein